LGHGPHDRQRRRILCRIRYAWFHEPLGGSLRRAARSGPRVYALGWRSRTCLGRWERLWSLRVGLPAAGVSSCLWVRGASCRAPAGVSQNSGRYAREGDRGSEEADRGAGGEGKDPAVEERRLTPFGNAQGSKTSRGVRVAACRERPFPFPGGARACGPPGGRGKGDAVCTLSSGAGA
jgi:hypothetical protein